MEVRGDLAGVNDDAESSGVSWKQALRLLQRRVILDVLRPRVVLDRWVAAGVVDHDSKSIRLHARGQRPEVPDVEGFLGVDGPG